MRIIIKYILKRMGKGHSVKKQNSVDNGKCETLLNKWHKLVCEEFGVVKIVSLFDKAIASDGGCNPITKTLCGIGDGGEVKKPQVNIEKIVEELIEKTEALQIQYDVAIDIEDESEEYSVIYNHIKEKIRYKDKLTAKHERLYWGYVEDNFLHHTLFNLKELSEEDKNRMWGKFWDCINKLNENNGIFSLKCFDTHPLKEHLYDFFDINLWDSSLKKLSERIDGKNVLIIDRCPRNGNKLSYEAETIVATFSPDSVTVVSVPISS